MIPIGHSWNGKEGRKSLAYHQDGKCYVRTEGDKFLDIFPEDKIEEEIAFNEREYADRLKRIEEEKIIQAKAEKNRLLLEDTNGYADQFPALKRGKIIAALNKLVCINKNTTYLKYHVERLVKEGRRVGMEEGQRVLTDGEVFLSQKSLGKIALDYAEYLIVIGKGWRE